VFLVDYVMTTIEYYLKGPISINKVPTALYKFGEKLNDYDIFFN
jgi:hypothetical protein